MLAGENDAPLLLDVSRLIWRRWSGMTATGIDRICLAWMEHYGPSAQAVVIHKYGQAILPVRASQALFRLLAVPEGPGSDILRFRVALAGLAIWRSRYLRDRLPGKDRFWLNPGHTGLDKPGLAAWCERRHLRPVHLIHDLIPITHPQFCREGEEVRHRQRMRTALDTAYAIVTNSAHTLETLRDFASAEGRAMPPAIVAWPGTPKLPVIPVETEREPTFVILGTIEGRKNHALLLDIWRQMIESRSAKVPRLVIVGRRGWKADSVFRLLDSDLFEGRVIEAGPLDDKSTARLLASARALLFPSFAEGFGMPLAEALSCGVPVIASDLPVFREIGQGVPELLPPHDQDAWRDAIIAYAQPDSVIRSNQIHRMEKFHSADWNMHFEQIDKISRLSP